MEIGNSDIQQKICEHINDPQTFINFALSSKKNAKHARLFTPLKKNQFTKYNEYIHHFNGGTIIVNQDGYQYKHNYKRLPKGVKHGQETIWFTGFDLSSKFVIRNWDTGILHGPAKIYMVIPPYSSRGTPYLFAELNYVNGILHGDQRIYHNWTEVPDYSNSKCQVSSVRMINGTIDLENRDIKVWQILNRIARSASIQPLEQQHIRVWRNCDACHCHIYPDMEYYHCWDPKCHDYDHCINCEMAGFATGNHKHTHEMRRMERMLSIHELQR
jgi:hypothetical protein